MSLSVFVNNILNGNECLNNSIPLNSIIKIDPIETINYSLIQKELNYKLVLNFSKYIIDIIFCKDFISLYSQDKDLSEYNIKLLQTENYDFSVIIKDIYNILSKNNKLNDISDKYSLFKNKTKKVKLNVNEEKLYNYFENNIKDKAKDKNKNSYISSKLIFSPEKIYKIIINFIQNINSDMSNNHTIEAIKNNPYNLLINLNYKNLKKICLNFTIDPYYFPFYAPILKINSYDFYFELIYAINNLDILKQENWNPIILLEELILEIANKFEIEFKKNLISDNTKNNQIKNIFYDLLSKIKLDDTKFDINIKLDLNKLTKNFDKEKSYWKSGTGYGSYNSTNWDINKYLEENKNSKREITNILKILYLELNESNIKILNNGYFLNFLKNEISGLNILEINKYSKYYQYLFKFLIKMDSDEKKVFKNFIYEIANDLYKIYEYFKKASLTIKNNDQFEQSREIFFKIIKMYDILDYIADKMKVDQDKKNDYINLVENQQFDTYESEKYNHYYMNETTTPIKKSIMRISSELSAISDDLPKGEYPIIFRLDENLIEKCTCIIVGPKDTPYHYGLFVFDIFLKNYPQASPKINFRTTGSGKVRFNPNLYNCGKVCLSLLGTWQGSGGESWNPDSSTLLQILISIQSLILIEEPYFNEPGYEKSIGTKNGMAASKKYNDNIKYQTIKWGMIDLINNPPFIYQDFIINHFKLKKVEIKKVVCEWVKDVSTSEIKKLSEELFLILDKL